MLGERKLQSARLRAIEERPWYGPFLTRFQFIQSDGGQPFRHDQYGRVYYNESYCAFAKEKTLMVLLLQIAEMFTRGHHWRVGVRDPQIWIFACLLETASSLQRQGFDLPRESLKPGWFSWPANKPAEFYYRKLIQIDRVKIPFTLVDDRGRPQAIEVEIYYVDGKLTFSMPEASIPGQFQDGPPSLEGLTPLLDPLLFGAVQREVFDIASEFGEIGAGEMPDWLLAEAAPQEGVLPWHEYLRLFLGDHHQGGSSSRSYTYSMPSLMQGALAPGLVFPSFDERSPRAAMVIDTSGSMNQDMLGRALGELDSLLRTLEITDGMTVIPTDAAAHTVQNVFAANQVVLEGRGGTNLGVGIDKACELNPRPETLIVVTDGYTGWPDEGPTEMDVVIVVVSKQWPKPEQKKSNPAPEWAKLVIEMFPYTEAA